MKPVNLVHVQCVCIITTGDESLQQLLFGQALLHLHPHHVTAEPPGLLLGLEDGNREGRGGWGWVTRERRGGSALSWKQKEIYYYYYAQRKMEQEENLNEHKGLFLSPAKIQLLIQFLLFLILTLLGTPGYNSSSIIHQSWHTFLFKKVVMFSI